MKLPSTALSIACHPTKPVLAVGLVSGGVAFGARGLPHTVLPLPGATRVIAFVPGTDSFLAASDAGHLSLVDSASSSIVFSNVVAPFGDIDADTDANADGPDALSALTALSKDLVIGGTDDGRVVLFDLQASSCTPVASILEQGDYISAIRVLDAPPALGQSASAKQTQRYRVAIASGDGSLCVYDVRTPPRGRIKLIAATPGFDDDLLSLEVFGGKAIGGTLAGAVNVYDLQFVQADMEEEDMGRFVERFHGHPESVSALVRYGEGDFVLTGSSDGLVRVVDYAEKKLAGVMPYLKVGEGEESESESSEYGRSDLEENDGDSNDESAGEAGQVGTGGKDVPECRSARKNIATGETDEVTKPTARRPRSKLVSWPIEGMAVLNGCSPPVLAVIGHTSKVRFCDLSLLDDDDDDEEEGNAVIPGDAGENAGSIGDDRKVEENKRASVEALPPAVKRRKGQKASIANNDAQRMRKQQEQKAFFSGI